MDKPVLAPYDWKLARDRERAYFDAMITEIYPCTPSTAMIVTNSFGGVPVDQWMVFTRFLINAGTHGYTSMTFIDRADLLTDARNAARERAWLAFGVDIAVYDLPF